VLADVASFAFVTRGKDYHLLDHPLIQARLHLPPDQFQQRPESSMVRSLYDCPEIPVGPEGMPCRVVVATHPAGKKKSPVGVTRAGMVYELFWTSLPHHAFTTCDVVELYLHRGAFEPALSDEDREQDPDRWCSHSAWGQECWQTVSQWVWTLRWELGHQLEPTPVRITEFAPAISEQNAQAATRPTLSAPGSGYGPPTTATRLGKRDTIFLFSPMEHCAVQQAARSPSRSGGKRLMGACGWCMQPAFATVVPVSCVSSANGMAAPPRSRARSAYSCIRSWLLQSPFFGRIGAEGTIDEPACICCTISGWIFRWHRAVCFPRSRRRQYFLGHGERIFGSRGQSA